MEPSILFVDDDPLILQALQRTFRAMQKEWALTFVESGAKALELMDRKEFTVVVSDMRMPGMDGAQFLAAVKERHSGTVRLILSGHADKELIMRCVGNAHQFLAKPCEPDALRRAIRRAVALDGVKSARIKDLIVRMDIIPSIPSIYSAMVEKTNRDDTSVEELGDLISQDLGITAKLLKLVNSAFFGLQREINTPGDAAAYLGFDTIKSLVLSAHAFASFEGKQPPGFTLESLWGHSAEVGEAARAITRDAGAGRTACDESFLAGMLHDLGKLILAVNLKEEYQRVLDLSRTENIAVFQAEEQILGANHADVGGYVLSLWGLSSRVVEAITFHHTPAVESEDPMTPLAVLREADALVHQRLARTAAPTAPPIPLKL